MFGNRYIENVVTLSLDRETCIGCGACVDVCPHRVLGMEEGAGKARIADFGACIECGACALNCPVDAVRVTPGVGCAAYIISGWINGKENASCGCGTDCC
jgi:ferredoxin